MKVEFTLCREDYFALTEYSREHDRLPAYTAAARRARAIFGFSVFGGFGMMLVMDFMERSQVSTPFVFMAVMYCLLGGLALWEGPVSRQRLRRKQDLARAVDKQVVDFHERPQSVELLPDCMLTQRAYSASRIQWTGGVDSVVSTSEHTFIYVSSRNAVIVPKRAFKDEADFRAFGSLAREYLRAGGGPDDAREVREVGKTKDLHCPRCRYQLKDIVGTRCSECGLRVAPADFRGPAKARSFRLSR